MSDEHERDLEVLRLQASVWALESLCIALVKASANSKGVLQQFELLKESFVARQLGDADLVDAVFQECEKAHARILGLLRPSSNTP